MDNPWIQLLEAAPFVLPSDQPPIDAFNRRYLTNARRTLQLDIRPEPFIGNIEAPIVLLYLNPGYTPDDHSSTPILTEMHFGAPMFSKNRVRIRSMCSIRVLLGLREHVGGSIPSPN